VGGMIELYEDGVQVSRIQRILSLGMLGVQDQRKIVPTRWSITAVDDTLSKNLRESVKHYPPIDKFQVYRYEYLDNVYAAILSPRNWEFEWIEAWFPGTAWNPDGKTIGMYGDWEGHDGRTTYASMGGCYYSARLAVCEQLVKERRQATAIVLREARPGYIMPVGVWQVRENVRNAMRQPPYKFNSLESALKWMSTRFQIPLQQWIIWSEFLKNALFQKKITDYFTTKTPVSTTASLQA